MKRAIALILSVCMFVAVSACSKEDDAVVRYHTATFGDLQEGINAYLDSIGSELEVGEFIELTGQTETEEETTESEEPSEDTEEDEQEITDPHHAYEAVVTDYLTLYLSYDEDTEEGFVAVVYIKAALEGEDVNAKMTDFVAVISGVIKTIDDEAELSTIYSSLDENLQIDYHSSKYEDEEYIFYYHYIKEATLFVVKPTVTEEEIAEK